MFGLVSRARLNEAEAFWSRLLDEAHDRNGDCHKIINNLLNRNEMLICENCTIKLEIAELKGKQE